MSKMNEVLITKNILSSLESIPFHNHIDCIKRLVPDTFPLHLAIHEVTDMKGPLKNIATCTATTMLLKSTCLLVYPVNLYIEYS